MPGSHGDSGRWGQWDSEVTLLLGKAYELLASDKVWDVVSALSSVDYGFYPKPGCQPEPGSLNPHPHLPLDNIQEVYDESCAGSSVKRVLFKKTKAHIVVEKVIYMHN